MTIYNKIFVIIKMCVTIRGLYAKFNLSIIIRFKSYIVLLSIYYDKEIFNLEFNIYIISRYIKIHRVHAIKRRKKNLNIMPICVYASPLRFCYSLFR